MSERACEAVRAELEEHLRGRLEPLVDRGVRAHLAECPGCRERAARLRPLLAGLEAWAAEGAGGDEPAFDPDALAERVLGLDARRGTGRTSRSGPRPARRARREVSGNALGLGVALLLLGGAGLVVWRREQATHEPPPPAPPRPPQASPSPPAPAPPVEAPVESPPVESPPAESPPRAAELHPAEPAPSPEDGTPGPAEPALEAVPAPEEPAVTAQAPPARPPAPAEPPLAPSPAPPAAPDVAPGPAAGPRLVCLVGRGHGAGRVLGTGGGETAAEAGALLAPGDVLAVQRGTLVLCVRPPELELPASLSAGTRLVLPRGARLRVDEQGLRLEAGECWAQVAGRLTLAAGPAGGPSGPGSLLLQDGDAHLAVGKREVQAQAWGGQVRFLAASGEVALEPGQRLEVDAEGRAGAPRRVRGEPPPWRLDPPDPAKVLFQEDCRGQGPRALLGLVGVPGPDGLAGAPRAEVSGSRVVCLGRGPGLLRFAPGARWRVAYRVAEAVPLTFQVSDLKRMRNLNAVLPHPRVGLWTEVEVDLERLAAAAPGGPLEAGDALDFFTVEAGIPGQTAELSIRDVVVER